MSYNELITEIRFFEEGRNREAAGRLTEERANVRRAMLSPGALEKPEELLRLLRAKPRYVGPGIWLKTIRELAEDGEKRNERSAEDSI